MLLLDKLIRVINKILKMSLIKLKNKSMIQFHNKNKIYKL